LNQNLRQKLDLLRRGDSKSARRARQSIKILLVVVLFIGLFWFIDFRAVMRVLSQAETVLVLTGLALIFPAEFLNAIQLRILAKRQNINHSVWQLFVINLSIKFYLLFLPGAIVGSGIRWYKLSHPGGKHAEALATVAFNRLFETFLVVVLGLGFWFISGQKTGQFDVFILVALFIFILLAWILITRISTPISKLVDANSFRWQDKTLLKRVMDWMNKLLVATSADDGIPTGELAALLFVGISHYLILLIGSQLLARSVAIDLTFADMGWIQSIVMLFALIPFTFAGGLGVREVGLVFMLSSFGVQPETAIAFSLLLFARQLLLGIAGGISEGVRTIRVQRSQ